MCSLTGLVTESRQGYADQLSRVSGFTPTAQCTQRPEFTALDGIIVVSRLFYEA